MLYVYVYLYESMFKIFVVCCVFLEYSGNSVCVCVRLLASCEMLGYDLSYSYTPHKAKYAL